MLIGLPPNIDGVPQVSGALASGTYVRKIKSEAGDTHLDGSLATIVRSFGQFDRTLSLPNGDSIPAGTIGYFVEWEDLPGVAVFITGNRIEVERVC